MKLRQSLHNSLEKIYEPGTKGEYKPKNKIWPVRPAILVFLVVYFHVLNNNPLFSLNRVTAAELAYGFYILILLSRRNLTVGTQLTKLLFDLSFFTLFEYISVKLYGNHSGLFVLFITPVIYCSYWFRWYVTVVYANIVAATYCVLNYHLLELGARFSSNKEIIRVLGPVVVLLYLVAAGGHYYKHIIYKIREGEKKRLEEEKKRREEEKKRLEEEKKRFELANIQKFTQSLLKSSFDAVVTADEDGVITDANERACELLGYGLEKIKGQNVLDIYVKDKPKLGAKELRANHGSIENFPTHVLAKGGEEIPILLSAAFVCDMKTLKEELSRGKKFPTLGYFKDMRVEIVIDEIARSITSMTNEKELREQIVEKVAKLLKAEACGLLMFDESISELRVVTSYGMPKPLKIVEENERYGVNEGMVGWCFNSNKPLSVPDIDVENEQPEDFGIKWQYARNFAKYSRYGNFKHFLGAPLGIQEEVYGVLRVLNKYVSDKELDTQGFTANDEKLLERISTQVSILLEKVRGRDRFAAILKVGKELNEMLDVPLEKMLKTIAEEVVKGMRLKACYLRLIEDGDVLRIKGCYGLKCEYTGKKEYDLKIGDDSITAKVVKSKKYRSIEDLSGIGEEYRFPEIIREEKVKSMLSMPLNYRGRVIGVINCYSSRIHKFTDQEIQVMETFAAYATTAIQNKRRVDEFNALNEISAEMVKPIELDELFKLIVERAKTFSGADRLCIKIYDEREGKVKTTHSLGCPWHEKHWDTVLDNWDESGNKAAREVYKTGKSQIVDNYEEIREHTRALPDYELMESIQSCALVPITIDERVYGLIFLESDRPDFFTEDDLLVLEAFSSQAAIALKNANFVNKLQRVTETFPRISELNVDIDKVLENIADIAAEVLETDVLVLYQYDEKTKNVEWPPIVRGFLYYPEFMKMPVDEKDAPYLFINRGEYHFADKSLEDPIMVPEEKTPPRTGIPSRFLEREKIKSSAGLLLRVGREIVGVIFVNYRSPHKFNEDERKIILNYASYIAIAIQNVRHFREKESLTALDAVQKLAAAVAHKMKNDIAAITLDTGRLLHGTRPGKPEHKILSRTSDHLNKITADIDSLLRASRLQEPEISYVDFTKLVRELESEFVPNLIAKNIKFKKYLTDDIPHLKLDPLQIKIVFSDLVHNSINAMAGGGKVTLSISKEDKNVVVHWQDTGTGIPEENASKIFEPYWTTKGSGFGVGLFLSKRVMEEHGGSIALDEDYDKGARFIIKFPIKEPIR
jgi:PAS domain S-box-containing protein